VGAVVLFTASLQVPSMLQSTLQLLQHFANDPISRCFPPASGWW